jgi:hypothetical protein
MRIPLHGAIALLLTCTTMYERVPIILNVSRMHMNRIGSVAEWSNALVCSTSIRLFESDRRLLLSLTSR